MNTNDRARLAERLIRLDEPLERIMEELGRFPWDSDELVTMSLQDDDRILSRYIEGGLTATQGEDWGNAVEVRDDIGLEPRQKAPRKDLIFELANPLLTKTLTRERAIELRTKISNWEHSARAD